MRHADAGTAMTCRSQAAGMSVWKEPASRAARQPVRATSYKPFSSTLRTTSERSLT